jgi:hypothetical protein
MTILGHIFDSNNKSTNLFLIIILKQEFKIKLIF